MPPLDFPSSFDDLLVCNNKIISWLLVTIRRNKNLCWAVLCFPLLFFNNRVLTTGVRCFHHSYAVRILSLLLWGSRYKWDPTGSHAQTDARRGAGLGLTIGKMMDAASRDASLAIFSLITKILCTKPPCFQIKNCIVCAHSGWDYQLKGFTPLLIQVFLENSVTSWC